MHRLIRLIPAGLLLAGLIPLAACGTTSATAGAPAAPSCAALSTRLNVTGGTCLDQALVLTGEVQGSVARALSDCSPPHRGLPLPGVELTLLLNTHSYRLHLSPSQLDSMRFDRTLHPAARAPARRRGLLDLT